MLKDLKNVPATRHANNPALTHRAQIVLSYLVYGIDELDPAHPDIPTGKPLGPYQVAAILGVRRTYVRGLMSDPVFKTEMARAVVDARAALGPEALTTLAELMRWQGDGKAADANVRGNAARTIMGDDAKSFSVAVQVNQTNVTEVRPGYVLDLSALRGNRDKSAAPMIEAEPEP